MCVLSIKVPIRKKSGNLFNDPRITEATKRVSNGLDKSQQELEIRGRIETIQTTALLKESWRSEETCCHSYFCEKPLLKTVVQTSQGVNNKFTKSKI